MLERQFSHEVVTCGNLQSRDAELLARPTDHILTHRAAQVAICQGNRKMQSLQLINFGACTVKKRMFSQPAANEDIESCILART